MRTRRTALLALVVALLAALAVGCSDSNPTRTETSDPSVSDEASFEGLPVPPLADPVGSVSEKDGVVTRSYSVRNRTADRVFEFYEDELASLGWERQGPIEDAGRNVRRGTWDGPKGTLEVTTTEAELLPDESTAGDRPDLQLSLLLRR
ncbi:MAG: hypothetical protein R2702_16245 [Acidimicrobiales bacterium]